MPGEAGPFIAVSGEAEVPLQALTAQSVGMRNRRDNFGITILYCTAT